MVLRDKVSFCPGTARVAHFRRDFLKKVTINDYFWVANANAAHLWYNIYPDFRARMQPLKIRKLISKEVTLEIAMVQGISQESMVARMMLRKLDRVKMTI